MQVDPPSADYLTNIQNVDYLTNIQNVNLNRPEQHFQLKLSDSNDTSVTFNYSESHWKWESTKSDIHHA